MKTKEERANEAFEKGKEKAKVILEDENKAERFLQRLEKKLKEVPIVGEKLAYIPIMASLARSYIKKEYVDVPIGTMIAIISALLYFVSPIDLIPDNIPVLGYGDDALVAATCWKLVESDVKEYEEWRKKHGKIID